MVAFHSGALPLLRSAIISYPLPLGVRHFVTLRFTSFLLQRFRNEMCTCVGEWERVVVPSFINNTHKSREYLPYTLRQVDFVILLARFI
jgi:hypothetical protein